MLAERSNRDISSWQVLLYSHLQLTQYMCRGRPGGGGKSSPANGGHLVQLLGDNCVVIKRVVKVVPHDRLHGLQARGDVSTSDLRGGRGDQMLQ